MTTHHEYTNHRVTACKLPKINTNAKSGHCI